MFAGLRGPGTGEEKVGGFEVKVKLEEGWAFVSGIGFTSKKAHFIQKDGRSLCGRYAWFGEVWEGPQDFGLEHSRDYCKSCIRKLTKRRREWRK